MTGSRAYLLVAATWFAAGGCAAHSAAAESPVHAPAVVRVPDRTPPAEAASEAGPPRWIGIRFEPNTTRVVQVITGAPGERAGVKLGDEVVSLDGIAVTKPADFTSRIRTTRPGASVTVVVSREGKELALTVTPAERPAPARMLHDTLIDRPAPPFDAPSAIGAYPAKLADLAGHVVIVDFWASWCGPCLASIPHLDALATKYGPSGLRIVGLSGEEPAVIAELAAARKLAYTVAHDADDRIAQAYLVQGIPTLIVIDKTGTVRYTGVGLGDQDALEALVVRLLQ